MIEKLNLFEIEYNDIDRFDKLIIVLQDGTMKYANYMNGNYANLPIEYIETPDGKVWNESEIVKIFGVREDE